MLNAMNQGLYVPIGLVGNAASPDLDKWLNARAYWYDTVREEMRLGHIDLQFDDEKLQDELLDLEYKFSSSRNSLQIDSKDDIRKRLGKSPDYADAFIYAAINLDFDPSDPLNQMEPGEEFEYEIEQLWYDMTSGWSPL